MPPQAVAAGSAPAAVVLADLDGDGDLDIAVANSSPSGGATVLLRTGCGPWSPLAAPAAARTATGRGGGTC